jgi:pyruvate formate lyase activating enzyme
MVTQSVSKTARLWAVGRSIIVVSMKNGGSYTRKKINDADNTGSLSGVIFDIQRFSIHDGPGIRTTVFFKGCPLRCAWCQNPESHERNPEIAFYAEQCLGCFTCRKVCTEGAIIGERGRRVDYSRCTVCGECVFHCPAESLRMIGVTWDVDALVREILKDRDYFMDSGGGVTLSGGEPLMQPGFAGLLLRRLRGEKIHTVVETCGMFRLPDMKTLLPHCDMIYYDLKHMDGKRHREYTGTDNRHILENFTRLSAIFKHLQARMPVIPGINDDEKNIRATARFLIKAGRRDIHCLPYHNFGEAKISRLRTPLRPLGLANAEGDVMARVKKIFKEERINAVIYD